MRWFKTTPFPVVYCICSMKELQEWCIKRKQPFPEVPSSFVGITATIGARIFVVVLPDKHKKPWEMTDTIIHESVHVFQGIQQYIGETVIGAEVQAYTIAAIATNLLKEYDALHEKWKA